MSNLSQPPAEWLAEQFEFEWCAECGRDHRHHTAISFAGNWFAQCDRTPVMKRQTLQVDPEGYESGDSFIAAYPPSYGVVKRLGRFVAVYADGSRSEPQKSYRKAVDLLPPHVAIALRGRR